MHMRFVHTPGIPIDQSSSFQPKIKALQAAINEREKRISKLRIQKNKIEDAIFADFCKQIHVANIR